MLGFIWSFVDVEGMSLLWFGFEFAFGFELELERVLGSSIGESSSIFRVEELVVEGERERLVILTVDSNRKTEMLIRRTGYLVLIGLL